MAEVEAQEPVAVPEPVEAAEEAEEEAQRPKREAADDEDEGAEATEATEDPAPPPVDKDETAWEADLAARMYIVRVPKPDVGALNIDIEKLDAETKAYKLQQEMVDNALSVIFSRKSAAREQTEAAHANWQVCRKACVEKRAEVMPYREKRKAMGKDLDDAKEAGRLIDAKTEAELDQKIAEMEYRIQHESIPLSEEKQLVRKIKELEKSREKVKEYEANTSSVDEIKQARKLTADEAKSLEDELRVLNKEDDVAHGIWKDLRAKEDEISAEIDAKKAQRDELRDLKNEKLTALRAARDLKTKKYKPFIANREFARDVRGLAGAADLEGARAKALEQTGRMVEKFATDAAFRKTYLEMWETQRKNPLGGDVTDLDSLPAKAGKGRGIKPAPKDPSGKSRAQLAIEAALAAADEEISKNDKAKEAKAAKEAAAAPPPAAAADEENTAPNSTPAAEPPVEKAAPPPKRVVPYYEKIEIPDVDVLTKDAKFVVPKLKGDAAVAPSAAQKKRQEREEQARKQAEAKARKEKEANRKAARVAKALENSKKRAEEAKAKKSAAAAEAEAARIAAAKKAEAEAAAAAAKAAEAEEEAAEGETPIVKATKAKAPPSALQKSTRTPPTVRIPKRKVTMTDRIQKSLGDNSLIYGGVAVLAVGAAYVSSYFF